MVLVGTGKAGKSSTLRGMKHGEPRPFGESERTCAAARCFVRVPRMAAAAAAMLLLLLLLLLLLTVPNLEWIPAPPLGM